MFLAFVGPLLNHSGDIVKAVSELVASSRAGSRWAFGSSKIMHFHRLCLFYQGKNPMVQLNTKCCCKSVSSLLFIEKIDQTFSLQLNIFEICADHSIQ